MEKFTRFKVLPKHIGVILDGNGRWALRQSIRRVAGHFEGAKRVKELVESARELNIAFMTLYVFSEENWKRPKTEVSALLTLLKKYLMREKENLINQGIKLTTIGNIHKLPDHVKKVLFDVIDATQDNSQMSLILALSYGGRTEIVNAAKELVRQHACGNIHLSDINEQTFSTYLETSQIPDPDIIIRTSGEKRTSNFLPWQSIYSEFFFIEKLWPEFHKEDFHQILAEYQTRQRRYGDIMVSHN